MDHTAFLASLTAALGSCGAEVEAIPLDDEWTSVEGWGPAYCRHVAILIHPDIPVRFATSVRDHEEKHVAVIVIGEAGVRELGRWLMHGGALTAISEDLLDIDRSPV